MKKIGGVMSYAKGKLKAVDKRVDQGMGHSYSLGYAVINDKDQEVCLCKSFEDAKRIVHCVNTHDGLVEACKKTIILISGEHFKYNDTITLGHIEILQMLKDRLEQAIAMAEEE